LNQTSGGKLDIEGDKVHAVKPARMGVKFHDGNPCDARTVQSLFCVSKNRKNPSHTTRVKLALLDTIRVFDPLTVKAHILHQMHFCTSPLNGSTSRRHDRSPAAVQKIRADYGEIVGTGAIQICVPWKEKRPIELEAKPATISTSVCQSLKRSDICSDETRRDLRSRGIDVRQNERNDRLPRSAVTK